MVLKDKAVVTSAMGVRVESGRAGNMEGGYIYICTKLSSYDLCPILFVNYISIKK